MAQTIGFIGVGQIGGDVAQLAVDAGYNVVLSNSRGPESLKSWVNKLGPQSSASTAQDIAKNDNIKIVVLSVPLIVVSKLLSSLEMKNKVILDTSNYYPMRDGDIKQLQSNALTTCEYVAQYLDDSNKSVKVFNNIDSIHLLTNATKDTAKQTTLPIAGDDKEAKSIATEFINNIGYQVLDYGTLQDSWKQEPNTPVYCGLYMPEVPSNLKDHEAKEYWIETPGKPLSKAHIQKYLDETTERPKKIGGTLDPSIASDVIMERYAEAAKDREAESA